MLALWASAASADQLTGTISNIDLTRNSFTLEGWEFRASPYNTVGAKLSELKDGDKVTIEYTTGGGGGHEKWPMNVMILKKAGLAHSGSVRAAQQCRPNALPVRPSDARHTGTVCGLDLDGTCRVAARRAFATRLYLRITDERVVTGFSWKPACAR